MIKGEDKLSPRQLARQQVREAGKRSSKAAHTLMSMPESALQHLDLDKDLISEFIMARNIKTSGARRREERRLAGTLRQEDLNEIEAQLTSADKADKADAHLFKQTESWRTRLIAEDNALVEFHEQYAGQDQRIFAKLVHEAQREQQGGKPKGASKALFRHIASVLKASTSEHDSESNQ